MSPDLNDLLPLFLSEARERLEHLADLSPSVDRDEVAGQEIRRELHALKGASRMMRLEEISDACHEGETLLTPPFEEVADRLVELVDRMFGMVGELEGASKPRPVPDRPPPARTKTAPVPGPASPPPGGGLQSDVRVPASSLAELADRATRLRILALGGIGLGEQLAELSRAAERSVNDDEPRQVIATLAASLRHLVLQLEAGQDRMLRQADRLLDRLLGLQLQPLRPFLQDLARHARELGRALGKQVRVEVDAEGVELDRRLLIALEEALLHLVRNAVDHGIEAPEARELAGKPAESVLRLDATGRGREVRIVVTDDGAGILPERILEAAQAGGVVSASEAEQLGREDVLQLLFRPGFSMADRITKISGRGVGLDAVATGVRRVGGDVTLQSTPGQGTSVHLRVPLMRRGDQVLVLRTGDQVAAVPSAAVASFVRLTPDLLKRSGDHEMAVLRERLVPVHRLSRLLGEPKTDEGVLLELSTGGSTMALLADAIAGEEEVLIRPFPAAAGRHRVFDSMTLLSNARPVPVISPSLLSSLSDREALPQAGRKTAARLHVLLVDDSTVTREMLRRLLEDGGCTVRGVSSAAQALQQLAEARFDCLITDIEMPRMDGLELTRQLRATPALAQLPVVVVSTRDSAEDRLAGLHAGADAYITKQGMDSRELLQIVRRLGGGA